MNILFIASSADIKAGTGEAIHVRELAINLADLGHRVSLIAGYSPDSSDELYILENHPNIELYYNKNIFKIPFPRSHDISGILTCLKVARENPPDVIYERCFICKFGTVLSKLLRKPFVLEINGLVDEEAKLQGTYKDPKYTKHIRMKFRRYFFNSSNRIVTVTQGLKEELQKKYHIPPGKIIVIPNGANTDLFKHMDQNTVKDELGLSYENMYVCFVGKLLPWQGVEYLIQAAPMVLKIVPETRFLIVGDGMMQSEWKGMVKKMDLRDKFVFTGSVPFEEVPKYINVSDVCVHLPFGERSERVGASALKLFEYMACGKSIVVIDTSGIPKEIERANAGILVSCNLQEIANSIIKLLKNEKLRVEMGKNGRKCVVENYSWKSTAERVTGVCNNVIKERKYS